VAQQQFVVERVGVVEVAHVAVAERDVLEVLVVGVLVDDHDAIGAELAHDGAGDQRLSRAGATGDADEDAARHAERNLASARSEGQRGGCSSGARESEAGRKILVDGPE
jgi:hypothetical protein